MRASVHQISLKPIQPFRISRGTKTEVINVFIRLESKNFEAWGEASPNAYYGESSQSVSQKLNAVIPYLQNLELENSQQIKDLWHQWWPLLAPSRAAQCALDIALWDLLAQQNKLSLSELLWNSSPKILESSITIPLCEPAERASVVHLAQDYPRWKVKAGSENPLEWFQYIAEKSSHPLWVDVNAGWSPQFLHMYWNQIKNLPIALLEQPLSPEFHYHLNQYLPQAPFDLIADESCKELEDMVEDKPFPLYQNFHGVNIKLVKCGGITPALDMIQLAQKQGLKIMLGCMLESDCLISAGYAVGQVADYLDLDGSWLLANKPFKGVHFERGKIWVDNREGLGVSLN